MASPFIFTGIGRRNVHAAQAKVMATVLTNGGEWTQKYGSILQTVIVLALPFSALWIGAIVPIQNAVDKLDKEKLSIREHAEFVRGLEKELTSIEQELLRIRGSVALKDELGKTVDSVNSRMSAQANRVMKLEDELHGSANISKSIDRIQEHLTEVDRRLLGIVKDSK